MEKRYAISFFPQIKKRNIAFFHIPKAAGYSVSHAIYGEQIGHLKWVDVFRSNPIKYEELIKFAVCRDPFERFLSAFNFLKDGGLNERDAMYAKEFLASFDSVNDFVKALHDEHFRTKALMKVHFHTQTSFVCRSNGEIMVDHLIMLDRIHEDLPRLFPDAQDLKLPHLNKSDCAKLNEPSISAYAKQMIRNIYEDDFKLIGFCRGHERVRGLSIFEHD